MSSNGSSSILIDITSSHSLLIICSTGKIVDLKVDEEDLMYNADGELDCPVDVVLRKNNHSFEDFNDWGAKEIQFVRRQDGNEEILRSIPLNINL
ncbi:hypothetical protein [Atopococcus tabaci]|uniref:hypothetical protein n=1 Tax=Atopococcus tabaci TaxID=269774 RepID=UPI00146FADC4|nr:hypothetical protein [Atopococcus tabaci]